MSKDIQALPVIENGLAPAGGLKPAVAADLRGQIEERFLEANGYVRTPRGAFVKAIAQADGTTVYAKLTLAITNDVKGTLFNEPKASKGSATVEVPSID